MATRTAKAVCAAMTDDDSWLAMVQPRRPIMEPLAKAVCEWAVQFVPHHCEERYESGEHHDVRSVQVCEWARANLHFSQTHRCVLF